MSWVRGVQVMKANSSSQPRKCHGLTDESARVRPTSLVALSVVWFSLCSCLVWKKQRLFRVFFSFLGNFIVARALQQRWSILPAHKVPSAVGLLNSLSALFSAHQGFEYTALSIMAGYLAFDHWYSALRLSLTFSWGVLEDTLSLSVALILLVMRSSSLHEYTTPIQLWILYKSLVFLRRLSASRRQPFKKRLSVPPRVLIPSQPPKTLKSAELWSIHGVHYDLSDFVNRHPGGRDAILLGRGRDCTALFESYHPFTNQHRLTLQKYRCDVKPGPVTKDDSPDDFYNELCVRVAKTLNEKGIHPIRDRSATWQRTAYYVVIGSAAVASGVAHCRGSLLGSWLFAVFGWALGALGHDAGHFAASRRPWVNHVGLLAMSLLSNPCVWQHQHTYAHHSHTNSFTHDPDLHHFELLLRVHKQFLYRPQYRFQSNLFFVLTAYTLVVFGTCFWIPWRVFQESSLYGMVDVPRRTCGMRVHFVGYTVLVLVMPFVVHNTWIGAALAVLAHVSTSGMLFALFSQINHLNHDSLDTAALQGYQSHREGKNSWAMRQVETSNNFATHSGVWHVLSNGLNLQIEHHLFPGLNHCHLHHITDTVQETCAEYGVRYKSYEGWWDVFAATREWLDRLSKEP